MVELRGLCLCKNLISFSTFAIITLTKGKIMTTITIKEDLALKKTEYQTAEEFVENYLSTRDEIALYEIDESTLPDAAKKDLKTSIKLGLEETHDFQG